MSSTISTLLISIGAFLVVRIEPKNWVFFGSIVILAIGILIGTLAIWCFIQSYSLRRFTYPMTYHQFFDVSEDEDDDYDDEQGVAKYKESTAELFRTAPMEKYNKHMIKVYLESMRDNDKVNNQKAKGIKNGQKLLLAGVISVSTLLGFILISAGLQLITIQ